jgi:hypothetical protein
MNKICEYCGQDSVVVTGLKIYPHRPDLKHLMFYYCDYNHKPAYVGCHKGSIKPLGRLANAELRGFKSAAHQSFDPLWKIHKIFKSRGKAYNWLASSLNIKSEAAHIGMFDVDMCKKVIAICSDKLERSFL